MIVADLASSLSDAAAAIVDPLLTPTGLIATAVVAVLAGGWFAARRSDNTRVAGPLATIGPAVGVLWLQIVYFPIQGGMYLFGLEMGVLIALVAVGMALIYRANRILNFAQTDLGLVPTVLAVDLIVYSGLNYFVSFSIGLVAAIVLGAVVELAIIRRFFRSPRLILTVATIGLSQLLLVGSLMVPTLIFGKQPASEKITTGLTWSFELFPRIYSAEDIVALILAPIVLIGVALFLRYTNIGIGIRASAERADRAALLGVPVKRLQTIVWVIATVMSFLGVFLRASTLGLPLVSTPSYTALLVALAALMLGRLTNLASVALAAVALGLLEQAVVLNSSNSPELFLPIVALIILGTLLLRKTGQSRTEQDTASSWQAADEVRPVPRELRRVPEVVAVRWGLPVLGAAVLLALPIWLGPSDVFKAAAVVVFGIIGMSIVVLTGWAGQVSLGQMSFVAVGATMGALATKEWGLDLFLALLIAGVAGAVAAIVVGLPALRVRGLFLAVTTLAFAVATSSYLLNRKHFAWIPDGQVPRRPLFGAIDLTEQRSMYYLVLAVGLACYLALRGVRRSRTGRVLLAQRENERGVQSYGVNLTRAKLSAFALSGFMAAIAGCLYVHLSERFVEAPFTADQSFAVFTSTVVGGLGALSGGFLGSLYFNGGTWYLKGLWQLLPSALGVLIVLMVLRGGLGGLVFQVRDVWLRSVARRNGIVVPSLLADVRTEDQEQVLAHAEEAVEEHDGSGPGASDPAAATPDREDVAAPDAPVSAGGGAS